MKRTAELHAAGFAFGQPYLVRFDPETPTVLPVQVEAATLYQIGLDMYVTGVGEAQVIVEGEIIKVVPGEGCDFQYLAEPDHLGTPGGALWGVAVNHHAIMEMLDAMRRRPEITAHAVQVIEGCMSGLLPANLINPATASTLDADAAANSLVYSYCFTVRQMKDQFVHQLAGCAGEHGAGAGGDGRAAAGRGPWRSEKITRKEALPRIDSLPPVTITTDETRA